MTSHNQDGKQCPGNAGNNSFFFTGLRFATAMVVFSISLLVTGCENDPDDVNAYNRKEVMVEVGRGITSYLSQGGKMRAKLTAPVMYRYQADSIYVEFPNTLHVDFYDDSTRIESRLDAKYGKYFETLNKVYLRDSVIVYNVKGDTMRCPELWWDQQTQRFYNDKPTRIDTKTQHQVGLHGIEASQDFSQVILRSPRGTMQVKESGFPE